MTVVGGFFGHFGVLYALSETIPQHQIYCLVYLYLLFFFQVNLVLQIGATLADTKMSKNFKIVLCNVNFENVIYVFAIIHKLQI